MAREHIGERIREARLRAGLSQVDLAERAGVRQPTMYRYERRGMVPGAEVLTRIASALGVSERWLMHGEDAPPEPQARSAPTTDPSPPHWNAFLSSYEYLDELSEADLLAMRSFAARTHRVRSWYDWAQLAEWLRNRKPSMIFEKAKDTSGEER